MCNRECFVTCNKMKGTFSCLYVPVHTTNEDSTREPNTPYTFAGTVPIKTANPQHFMTSEFQPTPVSSPQPMDNTGYPTPPPLPSFTRRRPPFRRRKTSVAEPTPTASIPASIPALKQSESWNYRETEAARSESREAYLTTTKALSQEEEDTSTEEAIKFIWSPTPGPGPNYPALPPPASTSSAEEEVHDSREEWWIRRKTTPRPLSAYSPSVSLLPTIGGRETTPRPSLSQDVSRLSNSSLSFIGT